MSVQPNSLTPDQTHEALVTKLREQMGPKAIAQLYSYREQRRKDMLKFWISYDGEDRMAVHALGKLWLRTLNHTLWNVEGQDSVFATPDQSLYEMDIVGLCYEWHDFATFLEVVNKLPGYDDWLEEIEELGGYHTFQALILRVAPGSNDRLLRPTSAVFYDTRAAIDDIALAHRLA